jgi:hypothetical protein
MHECKMCHDAGEKSDAVYQDGDGIWLCQHCWDDCIDCSLDLFDPVSRIYEVEAKDDEIERLRDVIKEHHELIHSTPHGHAASVNVLYDAAFPSDSFTREDSNHE